MTYPSYILPIWYVYVINEKEQINTETKHDALRRRLKVHFTLVVFTSHTSNII